MINGNIKKLKSNYEATALPLCYLTDVKSLKIPKHADFWIQNFNGNSSLQEGNILHCTKKTQNKTEIAQWRLLKLKSNFVSDPLQL